MTWLTTMTIHVSVTAAVLLCIKFIFKKHLSAKWQFCLWGILLVRLCMPILPQSGLSVYNVVKPSALPRTTITAAAPHQAPVPSVQKGAAINAENEPAQPSQNVKTVNIQSLLRHAWMIGAILLFCSFILPYLLFCLGLRHAESITDAATLKRFETCKKELHIKRRITLRRGDTPMLKGMICPTVILPEGYTEAEERNIFIHELCHYKNGDILYLWLAVLILCLNWFNPIIWYAFFSFRRDVELYCDQRALAHTENKKEYASLLLKSSLRKNNFVFGTTALQNGEKEVTRRIRHIAYFKKPSVVWSVALPLVALTIAALCLTNAAPDIAMSDADFTAYMADTQIGAIMADLDYASEEKIVFHYLRGLFVYDVKAQALTKRFDLSQLNVAPHQQGSNGLSCTVSADGSTALLTSYGPEDEIRDFETYQINLNTGRVRKTQLTELSNPFTGLTDTYTVFPQPIGWSSNFCAVMPDGTAYYLTTEQSSIGGLELVHAKDNEILTKTYVLNPDFKESLPFAPTDIHDLTEAVLSYNGNTYSVNSSEGLQAISQTLQSARNHPVKGGSSCPFEATLSFVRTDGQSGYIYLATDSCGMLKTEDEMYYKYADNAADISNLLMHFGLSGFEEDSYSLKTMTEQYLRDEFRRVYGPIYKITGLRITDWKQSGNEASFRYQMTYEYYNREPDKVAYIQEAKKEGQEKYEALKADYLAPKESNYEFKVTYGGDPENPLSSTGHFTLYYNVAPKGEEWQEVTIDDFIVNE